MPYYHFSEHTDPYLHFAEEEKLLKDPEIPCAMMLYCNVPCICFARESAPGDARLCAMLESTGVLPVRRQSGGVPFFGGQGMLGFAFVAQDGALSLETQFSIIRRALSALDLPSTPGEEGLTVSGKRFLHSALLREGGRLLHHGTLFFDRNLPAPPEGYAPLRETNPRLTLPHLTGALLYSFELVCGKSEALLFDEDALRDRVEELRDPSLLFASAV